MSAVATTATTMPQALLHPCQTNSTTINTTIVQLVLDRLTQPDAFHAAQVCKDWLSTVQHHLLRSTLRSPAALEHVTTRFANLERLALHNVHMGSVDLKLIARLRSLQSLTLDTGGPGDASSRVSQMTGIEALASMRTLSHLTLRHMVLDPSSGLSHVVCKAAAYQEPCVFAKNKGALLELSLHACRVEATLEMLLLGEEAGKDGGDSSACKSPKALPVPSSSRYELARHHAQQPPHACQLQLLDLSHLQAQSPYVYKGLGKVTTLRTLVMRHVQEMNDNACIEVAKLTDLQSLDLAQHGAQAFRTNVTHRGIEALCSLPNLESLVLQGYAGMSNTTANLLCNLRAGLTRLDLRHSSGERHGAVVLDLHDVMALVFPPNVVAAALINNQAAAVQVEEQVEEQQEQDDQEEQRMADDVQGDVLLHPGGQVPQQQPQQQQPAPQQRAELHRLQVVLQRQELEVRRQLQQNQGALRGFAGELLGETDWLEVMDPEEDMDIENVLANHHDAVMRVMSELDGEVRQTIYQHQRVVQDMLQEQGQEVQELLQRHEERMEELQQEHWEETVTMLEEVLNQERVLEQQRQQQMRMEAWRQEQRERQRRAQRHQDVFASASVKHIVEGLPRLQSLVLSGDAVDRDACGAISHALPALTALELIHCRDLRDDALCLLEPLTMLRTLSMVNCDGVTDIGVTRILKACRLLQHVQLAHTVKVTSLSMRALHGLPLVSLDLSGNKSLKDEVLTMLVTACPLLETLVLDDCTYITDTGVCAVATHALQLRHLNLQYCSRITVRGLRALAALPRLEHVNAYRCIIGKAGLQLPGVEVVVEKPFWWTT